MKIGIPHYKDDYDGMIDGSAVLVINSVLRVEGPVDILFLDEITAVLACVKRPVPLCFTSSRSCLSPEI